MSFFEEMENDLDWRIAELASLRTMPLRYRLSPEHRELLIKYSVPSIYALWEGFVKNAFTLYAKEINKLEIPVNNAHINLVTHAISCTDKLRLENPRMNYKTKKEFVELFQSTIYQPSYLKGAVS